VLPQATAKLEAAQEELEHEQARRAAAESLKREALTSLHSTETAAGVAHKEAQAAQASANLAISQLRWELVAARGSDVNPALLALEGWLSPGHDAAREHDDVREPGGPAPEEAEATESKLGGEELGGPGDGLQSARAFAAQLGFAEAVD